MARMSNSLGAIFAANDRMLADERRRKAAEARAMAKREEAQSRKTAGGLVGTGLGALAFLNPATAPFCSGSHVGRRDSWWGYWWRKR